MGSISKPRPSGRTPPLCPVCGKATYSAGGIHPQCAVSRNDRVPTKTKPKAVGKSKPKTATPWLKRCPRCSRQVAARRHTCDCGFQFITSASS